MWKLAHGRTRRSEHGETPHGRGGAEHRESMREHVAVVAHGRRLGGVVHVGTTPPPNDGRERVGLSTCPSASCTRMGCTGAAHILTLSATSYTLSGGAHSNPSHVTQEARVHHHPGPGGLGAAFSDSLQCLAFFVAVTTACGLEASRIRARCRKRECARVATPAPPKATTATTAAMAVTEQCVCPAHRASHDYLPIGVLTLR